MAYDELKKGQQRDFLVMLLHDIEAEHWNRSTMLKLLRATTPKDEEQAAEYAEQIPIAEKVIAQLEERKAVTQKELAKFPKPKASEEGTAETIRARAKR